MAKPKVWYKHLKAGDKIVVKLLPGHSCHYENRGMELVATITEIYWDGCIGCKTEKSLLSLVSHYNLNIGFEGTGWERSYPANILRKVKIQE
jgi:hypothetical protein